MGWAIQKSSKSPRSFAPNDQEIHCQRYQSHLCEYQLMPNHISKECRYRDIECRYCHVGCEVKQPEQQMKEHMKEAVSDHLDLVTKRLSQKAVTTLDANTASNLGSWWHISCLCISSLRNRIQGDYYGSNYKGLG